MDNLSASFKRTVETSLQQIFDTATLEAAGDAPAGGGDDAPPPSPAAAEAEPEPEPPAAEEKEDKKKGKEKKGAKGAKAGGKGKRGKKDDEEEDAGPEPLMLLPHKKKAAREKAFNKVKWPVPPAEEPGPKNVEDLQEHWGKFIESSATGE